MTEAILVALLGGAAMAAFTLAVWVPARARESAMQRRISGFVNAGSGRPTGLAVDLGGRSRLRGTRLARRPQAEGSGALSRYLMRKIVNAQVEMTPGELGVVAGLVAAIVLVALGLLVSPPAGGGGAALVPLLAVLWLDWRYARIKKKFVAQLADTVSLLASSVRTGHSVQMGLENIAQETPEPTRSAFALVVREVGLGASMEDALARLAERYPSEDIELVVTAVNVNAAIGGSLARILDSTADTIRERFRMANEVKALTAQQRYSAYVLALLPVFTLIALSFISPDYAGELFAPGILRIALFGAGGLVLLGFFIMRKMASVDD